MDALMSVAPQRHPWLERLISDPAAEVRRLAEGTASIHPYGRAEPSDAAATVLFGLAPDDPAVVAFDQGALEVLAQYRAATARAKGVEVDRVALAALDLIKVIQRLVPRSTVVDLHRRFPYWNAGAETLVIDRGLDLRREYYRVLALTQDIAAEAGLPPRRLLSFWLDLCGEAGRRGRYDESYLTVGLLGLRSLPLGDQGANEEAALHGLARWADAQRPSKVRFMREWRVLEGAFPHDPTFWTDLVARVLAAVEEEIARQTEGARDTFPAAGWWREDVDALQGQAIPPRRDVEPASQSEWQWILDRIGKPLQMLTPRIDAVIRKNECYANITGDTFYVVRTACNIGRQLLRSSGDELAGRAAQARELARLALRFEPSNVFAWALWRDALAAEGHLEAAERIGWETIRQYPENPQWRTQLALLLADRLDRAQEAEALLRETMRLFSEDRRSMVVAHTQLAHVVGRQAARLKEAIDILDQALAIKPADEPAQHLKSHFEAGKTSRAAVPPTSAMSAAVAGISDLPAELAGAARLRRALFRVRTASPEAREAARREVETMLNEEENLAYARYVAAAAGLVEPAADDTVIAAAYLAAARKGSAEAFRPLDARAQGLDGIIINLAGASRGNGEAATRLEDWLAEPANNLSPRDRGLRAMASRVATPLPPDFVGDMLAASLGTALAA